MSDLLQLIRIELRGTWRYRWLALAIAWVLCVAGWLFVFSMPDVYEARARVYVDADSRLRDVVEKVGVAPDVTSRVFVVRTAMLGRPQLERVARETDLDLRARTQEEQEALIESLRERIRVGSGRQQQARNLYTIAFEDRDKSMALSVVQELLDTFVEDVLELKGQDMEQASGYLEDQLEYYSGLLSDAEIRLANFKKQYVGLLPGESGGIFERLQLEMRELQMLRTDLQTEADRREELRRQLQTENPYIEEDTVTADGRVIPGIGGDDAQMSELEARRSELLLRYKEKHPDVIAINEQITQLQEKLKQEREQLAASGANGEGVSNSNNPVYQTVQIALNESGVRVAALTSQVRQREAKIAELNDQIDTIPQVEAEFAELTRDYAQYKTLYDELLVNRERERMGDIGDQMDVVSFNVIEPPAVSFEPVSPKRGLLLAAVLIFGLGAGGTLAFLLHKFNPVFHDGKTLRDITGRPVLGGVSMTWLERHKVRRRVDFSSFGAVAAGLVIAFFLVVLMQDPAVELMRKVLWTATG